MTGETTMDKHCLGCKYYAKIYENVFYCSYIFMEDKVRPCKPGKDCTVKVKGKPEKAGCMDSKQKF